MSKAFKESLKRLSLIKTLYSYFITKIVSKIGLHICWVYRFNIDIQVEALSLAENQRCHALSLDELKVFSQDPKVDLHSKHFIAAIENGDIFFGLIEDEKLIAYTWCAYKSCRLNKYIWIEIGNQQRYGYKAFAVAEYQGQRIIDIVQRASILLRPDNISYELAYIETHNFRSLNTTAFKRAEKQRLGIAGYWQIGSSVFCFRTPGVKKSGFRFLKK